MRVCTHEFSLGYVKFEVSVRLTYDDTQQEVEPESTIQRRGLKRQKFRVVYR